MEQVGLGGVSLAVWVGSLEAGIGWAHVRETKETPPFSWGAPYFGTDPGVSLLVTLFFGAEHPPYHPPYRSIVFARHSKTSLCAMRLKAWFVSEAAPKTVSTPGFLDFSHILVVNQVQPLFGQSTRSEVSQVVLFFLWLS